MTWKPEITSVALEKEMESLNVPEEDRDEVRRFAEFLKRRKDKQDGKELPPLSTEMRAWLEGKT
jgi:hypothetical protein